MDYQEFMYRAAHNISMPSISIPSGVSCTRPTGKMEEPESAPKREALGSDYAIKYRLQDDFDGEREDMATLDNVDGLSSVAGTLPNPLDIESEYLTQVYNIYPFDKKTVVHDLLVNKYKEEILEAIDSNSVIVIKGVTGCGKTTQVPQFILDYHAESNIHCNIVVTQPRRIATRSVATRVASERGWGIGTIVGYQLALEKKVSKDTRLLYCTTGVLLQQLISQQSLNSYTHIIVDEVHERDQETDFLLILLKTFLRLQGCRTKVILMSATMNTEKFQEYFSRKFKSGPPIMPPVISLKLELVHPVMIFYLDDLVSSSSFLPMPKPDLNQPSIDKDAYALACALVGLFHKIDEKEEDNLELGAVLIFLPGITEIEILHSSLLNHMKEKPVPTEKWWICPLHSSVTFDEQMKVFMNPPLNHRKIILATNIAESSITVSDVKYVIDFCLMKHQVQEPDTCYSYLQLGWVSKSQAEQRAGRVGRVRPGRVYRLVYKYLFEYFDKEHEPEILRCSLDSLVLKAKQLSPQSPPAKILAWAIDPPDLSNIQRTIAYLKEIGALLVNTQGVYKEDDGDLTFIGHIMASLPLDVQLSKLIIIGHMFSVLKEAIAMACACSVRSVFSTPFKKQLEAYNSKIAWSDSSCSDLIASLFAYNVWKRKTIDGYFARSAGAKESEMANRFFIQHQAMKEVYRLEQEVTERLKRLNITPITPVQYKNIERSLILKVIIAGAFYPNYFVRGVLDEKDAVKRLGGRNPFNTVYLINMPLDQPGILYAKRIQEYFKHCGAICNVSFDGSSKVYLTFEGNSDIIEQASERKPMIPGCVPMSVYRAIKLRQLNMKIAIPILPSEVAWQRANSLMGDKALPLHFQRALKVDAPLRSHLPGVSTRLLEVLITHVDSPSSFWVQVRSKEYHKRLNWLNVTLASSGALVPLNGPPSVGQVLAAPYFEGERKLYFRARVRTVSSTDKCSLVFFMDYGNCVYLRTSELMDFGPAADELREEPEMAMECSLTEVQPALRSNFNGIWSNLACDKFLEHFPQSWAVARIYSSVNNVVSMILYSPSQFEKDHSIIENFEKSFNYHLIKVGLADRCEEHYLSRENHNLRETALKRPDLVPAFASTSSLDPALKYVNPPSESECSRTVTLKGPMSPLEMKLYSLTRKAQGKGVNIEWNSVNSVLLDTYPQDIHERFMVAGLVTLNPNGDRLTLRNTTMMPNIHGLLSIVSMMFAPNVELRTDPDRTRLTGALCGLGCDPTTYQAYNPERDMEINFDVMFELSDLEKINKLRYQMNQIVFGGKDWTKEINSMNISVCQEKIKNLILDIVRTVRAPQGICGSHSFKWGFVRSNLLAPAKENIDDNFIFPLIWGIDLNTELFISKIQENLRKLQKFIDGTESLYCTSKCELCFVILDELSDLENHFNSTFHKQALLYFENVVKTYSEDDDS